MSICQQFEGIRLPTQSSRVVRMLLPHIHLPMRAPGQGVPIQAQDPSPPRSPLVSRPTRDYALPRQPLRHHRGIRYSETRHLRYSCRQTLPTDQCHTLLIHSPTLLRPWRCFHTRSGFPIRMFPSLSECRMKAQRLRLRPFWLASTPPRLQRAKFYQAGTHLCPAHNCQLPRSIALNLWQEPQQRRSMVLLELFGWALLCSGRRLSHSRS